jgi:hypothetical protein
MTKQHKFQQIRVLVNAPSAIVRFTAETDKQYDVIRGIYISIADERLQPSSTIGMKVNGQEVFDDAHEIRLLTCGNQVAPNEKFFLFEEHLEAAGSSIEGRFTDGANVVENAYPYEAKVYLWLSKSTEQK